MLRRFLVFFSLFVILGSRPCGRPLSGQDQPSAKPMPEFRIADWINADPSCLPSRDSLRGKLVLVDFWGTWCAPCLRSLPHIQELRDRYYDSDVVVVTIANQSKEKLVPFLQAHGYSLIVGSDPAETTVRDFRVTQWPTTCLVDRNGNMIFRGFPFEAEAQIEKALGRGSDAAALLDLHLQALRDRDSGGARTLLLRLLDKAPSNFDLHAWIRPSPDEQVPSGPERPSEAGDTLCRLREACQAGMPESEARHRQSLRETAPKAFDLAGWVRKVIRESIPLEGTELKRLLVARRYFRVLDLMGVCRVTQEAVREASADPGLGPFSRSAAGWARDRAMAALLTLHWVLAGKSLETVPELKELWSRVVSGALRRPDGKGLSGVIIDGETLTAATLPSYAERQVARSLVADSISGGKLSQHEALEAEVRSRLEKWLADLRQKAGE